MEVVPMETLIRPIVLEKHEDDKYTASLFSLLENKKCDEFINTIEALPSKSEDSPNLNCDNGVYTYLQYACVKGLEEVVKYLLDNGADINRVCNEYTSPPIIEAGWLGQVNIIKFIIDRGNSEQLVTRNQKGSNILHSIIMGLLTDNGENVENIVSCLKYVLEKLQEKYKSSYKDIVNEVDDVMGTPLHYVASTGHNGVILELLKSGASIVRKDKRGNFAFSELNKDIVEEFLNTCMNRVFDMDDCSCKLTFNFEFLAPEDEKSSEAEPLKVMSRSATFRQLLMHPVFAAYIDHKWQKVCGYYNSIACFYLVFVFLITAYILLPGNTTVVEEGSHLGDISLTLHILICCYLVVVTFVEIWQAVALRWEYVHSLQNWIDVLLIIMTTIMISRISTDFQQEISAAVIFMTWTGIILLLGHHPSCSKIVEMYKRVTFTFIQFLSCYSIFVVAFVLSFYVLLQDHNSKVSVLETLSLAIFNATLSLAGQLGPEDVPFDNHPVIGHLLFLAFVVLICINLFNLLNGLAVNDTREIIEEAELVGLISRVKFTYVIEKMVGFRCKKFISPVYTFDKTNLLQHDYKLRFLRTKVNGHYKWIQMIESIVDEGNGHSYESSREGHTILMEPIANLALEILKKDNKLAEINEKVESALRILKKFNKIDEITEKVDSLKNQFSDSNLKMHQDLKKVLSWMDKIDLKLVEENN